MAPVCVLPVFPVVPAELEVLLVCLAVVDLLEVHRLVHDVLFFSELTESSLLLFQARLLGVGELDLTLLESPLIGTEPRICWSYHALHFFWKVIQIYCEVGEVVLVLAIWR